MLRETICNTDRDFISQRIEMDAQDANLPGPLPAGPLLPDADAAIERVELLLAIRRRRKQAESDAECARRVLAMADAVIAACDAESRQLGVQRAM